MEKLAKHGPVVRRGQTLWVQFGIVLWIRSHQAAKLFTIKVGENLEEGSLGYGSQDRFHEQEVGCQRCLYQSLFSW